MIKEKEAKKIFGPKISVNRSLAEYTTLKIGGPAKFLIEVDHEEELINSVRSAEKHRLSWFILGGGSNLLVSDEGFNGLAIVNKTGGIKVKKDRIVVKSGEILGKMIKTAINHGLAGLEKMSGIPGTVGGAVFGNAGAYGQTISDHIEKVKIFDGKRIRWLDKKCCFFDYRQSIFSRKKWIILECQFRLPHGSTEELEKTAGEIMAVRSKRYPQSLFCPGSFFKNVPAEDLPRDVLNKIPPEMIIFGKVPAGYLLEQVGAKGKQKGKIRVADYHGNLICNLGGGKATDFFLLASSLSKLVKEKYGVSLRPEVRLIGFAKKWDF